MSDSTGRADSMALLARLRALARRMDRPIAYRDVSSDESVSYERLFRQVAGLAHLLRASVPSESVVLICCPNTLDFPVAFLGVLAAGCAAFPISTESPAAELRDVASRANVTAAVGSAAVLDAVGAALAIDVTELNAMDADDLPQVPRAGGNARLLLLSSGSTGKPKIVCRSGDAIDAVAEQMCGAIDVTNDDRVLATVPLCHSYGIEHGLLAPVWAGAAVHLCRGLDLPLVMRELREAAITVLPGVPAMFEMLAQLGGGSEAKLSSLRAAYSAGGPLPRSVFDTFAQSFGVRVSQLYGATEVGSVTYASPCDDHFDPGSVGRAMAGVEVRISAGNDSAGSTPGGQVGQVWIKARSVFSGYLGEGGGPVVDGFFPSGDIGRLDAFGNLTITGRIKLLIDVGGLKVNPIEVEDVLMQHPAIGDCVVVPVRQSETVMRLKAVVTARRAGTTIDLDDLRRFARERLAGYKVPRLFEVRESLPRTATGKLLRHLVQA